MSMFRAKKLDLGCFVKARTIRDHTKRKVFEEFETERYGSSPCHQATPCACRHCDTAPVFCTSNANYSR